MAITGTNVTINVKSLDKSISFYTSIGLKIKNRWGVHYAQLSTEGITIGLHLGRDANLIHNSGNTSIGFTVDNFQETKNLLEKLNIDITERKEEGGEFLHFADPDGTAIYFIRPKW